MLTRPGSLLVRHLRFYIISESTLQEEGNFPVNRYFPHFGGSASEPFASTSLGHLLERAHGSHRRQLARLAARRLRHHAMDHLAHLLEFGQELVDLLYALAASGGNTLAPAAVQNARIGALGRGHRLHD